MSRVGKHKKYNSETRPLGNISCWSQSVGVDMVVGSVALRSPFSMTLVEVVGPILVLDDLGVCSNSYKCFK